MKDGDSIPGLVGWETHGYLSTIYWADGLSEPPGHQRPYDYVPRNGPDARVQVITRNLRPFCGLTPAQLAGDRAPV
jgi:hypothetical protein